MPSSKTLTAISLLVVLLLPLPAQAKKAEPKPEVMTNADVVSLVKAGLSEEVVLSKIAVTPSEFDISTNAILGLKQQGVPESVIASMVMHGTNVGQVPAARMSWSNANPLRVTLEADGRSATLEARAPRDRYISTFVGMLWFKRLKGVNASSRAADGKLSILIPRAVGEVAVNLDSVHLVKLDVDEDDEIRQYRLDWFGPIWGVLDMDPEEDFLVDYDSAEEGASIRLTPRKPLKSGEYALVDERHLVYDFGVD